MAYVGSGCKFVLTFSYHGLERLTNEEFDVQCPHEGPFRTYASQYQWWADSIQHYAGVRCRDDLVTYRATDRKSVVEGKSVDLGGGRIMKKKR